MLTTLHANKYALIASALVLPAVAFELIGVSKFAMPGNPAYAWFAGNLGYPQINPVARALEFVVVIGPVLALLLALIPTVRFEMRTEHSSLISTITIKGELWNIAVITVSVIVLAILGTYIVLENWQCIIGMKASC